MKLLKNNIWTLFGLALVLMVAFTGDASAQLTSNSVVGVGIKKASNVFKSVRTIVFVIGGFGLVGLAVQAIFGKVKWPWFGALAVGLGVLAAAGALIEYATGDNVTTTGNGGYADTFKDNSSSGSTTLY
ncbi:MAG: TrbC/VirB2 family protein [Alphaproteobacteria bacterium]|nr:TrbC/VirB2 family protein [Alphaproteobacteria bacterium]